MRDSGVAHLAHWINLNQLKPYLIMLESVA